MGAVFVEEVGAEGEGGESRWASFQPFGDGL